GPAGLRFRPGLLFFAPSRWRGGAGLHRQALQHHHNPSNRLTRTEFPMTIKPGDKIPSATLMEMQDGKPTPVSTDSFFAGKKVALFALPGAFTPTCSAKHVPGFVNNFDALR